MPEETLTIANLANGAVVERFNHELQKVMRNIADPNTVPTKARTVTIKLRIIPDDTREISDIEISTTSTIVAAKPVKSRMYMSESGEGSFVATELGKTQMIGQLSVDDAQKADSKVTPMGRRSSN